MGACASRPRALPGDRSGRGHPLSPRECPHHPLTPARHLQPKISGPLPPWSSVPWGRAACHWARLLETRRPFTPSCQLGRFPCSSIPGGDPWWTSALAPGPGSKAGPAGLPATPRERPRVSRVTRVAKLRHVPRVASPQWRPPRPRPLTPGNPEHLPARRGPVGAASASRGSRGAGHPGGGLATGFGLPSPLQSQTGRAPPPPTTRKERPRVARVTRVARLR